MTQLPDELQSMNLSGDRDTSVIFSEIIEKMRATGYEIFEINDSRPWGGYVRFENSNAKRFIEEFFPGLSFQEASLDFAATELSPKILIVAPGQRLSWQYHARRAERWRFLTRGIYIKSDSDDQMKPIHAQLGSVVQFVKGERHRLVGLLDDYSLVAEIWQHLDASHPSNEEDIIRLADDYNR